MLNLKCIYTTLIFDDFLLFLSKHIKKMWKKSLIAILMLQYKMKLNSQMLYKFSKEYY